jgi:predicted AAA+ superfamily ATPase
MPFHRSIRKRQREAPKFYIFDTGVKRALSREIKLPMHAGTSEFGHAFEAFIILEIFRACEYLQNDFRLSYLRTKDDAEIDVVMERPGDKDLLLEIKSTDQVTEDDVRSLKRFLADWDRPAEAHVWSLDPLEKKIDGVHILPWQIGFKKVFG